MSRPFHLTPLKPTQIKQLCTLAGQAFKAAQRRGDPRTEDGLETYRKNGQFEAAQIHSLKDAHQGHYLALRGHWFTIIGNLEQAFYDLLAAGDQNEARRQMMYRFQGQLSHLADAIAAKRLAEIQTGLQAPPLELDQAAAQALAYAESISKISHKAPICDLDARGLEQLGFTITSRANAMLGRGNAQNRNKKQRQPVSKTPQPAPEEPLQRRFSPTGATTAPVIQDAPQAQRA